MSGTAGHDETTAFSRSESIAELAARREMLKAEVDKLSALDDVAGDRFEAANPKIPEEIVVKGDDRMVLDTAWFRPPSFQFAAANGLRQTVPAEGWRAMLANPPRLFGGHEVNERALERIRVGLAAAERYEELVRKADLETGYSAANDAWEAALDRLRALDMRILALRAQSLNDVVLQAAVVEARSVDDRDVPGELVSGLLRSIKALGTRAAA